MKIFRVKWLDKTESLIHGKNQQEALKKGGFHNVHAGLIDVITPEPTMTMTEIAAKAGLTVIETIYRLRGLMGRPELRKGTPDLIEYWTDDPTQNLLTVNHAEEFLRRLKEPPPKPQP